ncbi:MAG: Na+/H+ antiporter NhaA [Vicinamibacteria bacterium]
MKKKIFHFPLLIINSAFVLPIGCALALAWANIRPESYYRFSHALEFPVNEIGLVFLFAVMAKEVVEATLKGGDLHPWRRAALPVASAVGGVIVPAIIYSAFLSRMPEPEPMLASAWAVTCAIDVTLCYLIGGLIFGRHPAIPFLLLTAIASNAIGLSAIATITPEDMRSVAIGLTLVAVGMGTAFAMRRRGVSSFWPYIVLGGGLSWYGMFLAGAHPALALMPIVPFMPHAARDEGLFVDPSPKAKDTLSRFERWWAAPIQAVLFLFGLVNAGVPLHGLDDGMWAIPVATLIGRPIGVLLGAEAAIAFGLHRPPRMGWKELIVVGCTASVGLTMALYFSTASLAIGSLRVQSQTGALLTVTGAIVAFGAAWLLGVGRWRVADETAPAPAHRP